MTDHRPGFRDLANHHEIRARAVAAVEHAAGQAKEVAFQIADHIAIHLEQPIDDQTAQELFSSIDSFTPALTSRLTDLRTAIENFRNTIKDDP